MQQYYKQTILTKRSGADVHAGFHMRACAIFILQPKADDLRLWVPLSLPQLPVWFSWLSQGTFLRITFISFWAYLKLWQKEWVNLREAGDLWKMSLMLLESWRAQQPPGPRTHSEPVVCIPRCTPSTGVVLSGSGWKAWAEMLTAHTTSSAGSWRQLPSLVLKLRFADNVKSHLGFCSSPWRGFRLSRELSCHVEINGTCNLLSGAACISPLTGEGALIGYLWLDISSINCFH